MSQGGPSTESVRVSPHAAGSRLARSTAATLGPPPDTPSMAIVDPAESAGDRVEIASLVCGGRESSEKAPAVISLINVHSPLRYDDRMLGALLEYSEAGQPVIVTPFLMAGAMSPVGLAGTVAQQTAEALAGIALVQLIRPGTPSVYGSFLTNTDI